MILAAAGNTEIPAILTLEKMGYKISSDASGSEWSAEKVEQQFIACSPLELLGLIEMYLSRGEDWKAEDSEVELSLIHI